jgi:lysyl-tRNA synthetase, class I
MKSYQGEKMYWASELADKIIEKFPDRKTYVCSAGISPSGHIHIGNFRDIITSELVYRSLKAKGKDAKLIFSWDNFDRFRKVPEGVPESFNKFIGLPLTNIPDPKGELSSYAKRFETEFENTINRLGINPQIIYQSEQYESGRYDDQIRLALNKRKEIANILAAFKTQGMNSEQIGDYYPISIYSRFTGKDNTKVINYDGDSKITYRDLITNQIDTIEIGKDRNMKLPWRIDWPMRWNQEQVSFEPGGLDHAAPSGSYEVGKLISAQIFNNTPPIFQGYAFIGVRGLHGKMSGSTGNAITPKTLLEIYEPALLRWLFTRVAPDKSIDFSFDTEILRQYSEFDKEFRKYLDSQLDEQDKLAIELAFPEGKQHINQQPRKPISFRLAANHGQVVDFKADKLRDLLKASNEYFDSDSIESRLPKAETWLKKYNPSELINILKNPNTEYYNSLNSEIKTQIILLKNLIASNETDVNVLEKIIYSIPKKEDLSETENKKRQKEFFKHTYNLLIGQDAGPRLPTFIWGTNRKTLVNLLTFE